MKNCGSPWKEGIVRLEVDKFLNCLSSHRLAATSSTRTSAASTASTTTPTRSGGTATTLTKFSGRSTMDGPLISCHGNNCTLHVIQKITNYSNHLKTGQVGFQMVEKCMVSEGSII